MEQYFGRVKKNQLDAHLISYNKTN